MSETLESKLSGSSLKANLLQAVAAEDLDNIPLDLDDSSRFVVGAVRAVARRSGLQGFTIFIYSEAPLPEGRPHGFSRIMHMQDNEGSVSGTTILTSRDANNGASLNHSSTDLSNIVDQLISFQFDKRTTVIWNARIRTATVYPLGVADDQTYVRFVVPISENDLTQDEVCEVLNIAYNDNLKNPSGHTVKLWTKGKLMPTAEEEIERHLKGQISMFFAGRARPIRVLSQTNTAAGRTDLILFQKPQTGAPCLSGVVELKVLRGPITSDRNATTEGLSQCFNYREELDIPFSTLALYDVNVPPAEDIKPLLENQNSLHLASVRVRHFPIFDSPKAWRDAGAPKAA